MRAADLRAKTKRKFRVKTTDSNHNRQRLHSTSDYWGFGNSCGWVGWCVDAPAMPRGCSSGDGRLDGVASWRRHDPELYNQRTLEGRGEAGGGTRGLGVNQQRAHRFSSYLFFQPGYAGGPGGVGRGCSLIVSHVFAVA